MPTLAWVITVFALAEIALLNFDALPYAYRLKRSLMLTNAIEIDHMPPSEQDAYVDNNVYADEDAQTCDARVSGADARAGGCAARPLRPLLTSS